MIGKILANDTLMVLLLAAVLVTVSILLLNVAFQSTLDGVEWVEETYTVSKGDSLWLIADTYCPETVDRREWIDEVQALNDMQGATIYPGQELTILAPVEEV